MPPPIFGYFHTSAIVILISSFEIIPLNISCYFTFPLTRFYIQSRIFLLRRTDETLNFPICFFTCFIFSFFYQSHTLFVLFRMQRYVFSVFYLCDLCDLRGFGKYSAKNIMESFRRISPKNKNISPKDSTISPKDTKLSPKDSRISSKDKPRKQM